MSHNNNNNNNNNEVAMPHHQRPTAEALNEHNTVSMACGNDDVARCPDGDEASR